MDKEEIGEMIMAFFYLIRHGEPDYGNMLEKGFYGFGRSFAPLSETGFKQAEKTAKDKRLKTAELIVSSPYTRALQTAAIISRETGLKINVEIDLHEWQVDKTNQITTSEEVVALTKEFNDNKGTYPKDQQLRWETLDEMRNRIQRVADKYANYNKVILVGHDMAFRTLTYIKKIRPAEIVELEYFSGQSKCEYFFS